MADHLLASMFAGAVALMIALDCGLPLWRHLPVGDATDFGTSTAFAVWFAIKALQERGQ